MSIDGGTPEGQGETPVLLGGREVPSWLGFREQKEIERLSDSSKQVITRLTFTPESMLNTSRLDEMHAEVVDGMVKGKINEDEAVILLVPIEEKHQELKELESQKEPIKIETQPKLELPDDKEEQLKIVRGLLDQVENSPRDTSNYAVATTINQLEIAITDMEEDIAREVMARLSVHECAQLIRQAQGYIERPPGKEGGHTISSAVTWAQRRERDLKRETVQLLLRDGLPGLNVSKAWNLIQDANFQYFEIVKEINEARRERGETVLSEEKGIVMDDERELGLVDANFYTDPDPERRRAVEKWIIDNLTDTLDGDRRAARKSYQIADKLTIATLETSVFNKTAMSGNDELAEVIGLRGWRNKRSSQGRIRGPLIHLNSIEGFGTSLLRWTNNQKIEDDEGSAAVTKNVNEPIYAEDIVFNNIQEGSYVIFGTAMVGRYHAVKELLLKKDWKPDDFNLETFKKWTALFRTASSGDSDLEVNLKCWFLAGVLDVALRNPLSPWRAMDFQNLRISASRDIRSKEAGPFIEPYLWKKFVEPATGYGFIRLAVALAGKKRQGVIR